MRVELYKEVNCPIKKQDIAKITNKVLKVLNLRKRYSLSLAVVKESTARSLNRNWRGINRPASVLSFEEKKKKSKSNQKRDNKQFILPSQEKNFLGEIIIAHSIVQKNSARSKSSYKKEFEFLFTHGLLHLLGYNHGNIHSKKIMEKLEKRIRDKVD